MVVFIVDGGPGNWTTRRQTNSPTTNSPTEYRPICRQSNSPTNELADNPIRRQPTRRQSNAPTNQLAEIEIMLVYGATTLTVNTCTCNKPASVSNWTVISVIEAHPAVNDLLLSRSGDGVPCQDRMHSILRRLLALPLLPAEHIQPAFAAISSAGVPDAAAVDQQYCCRTSVQHGWRAQYGQQTCLYTASTYAPTMTWKERQIWPDIKKTSSPFGGRWVI